MISLKKKLDELEPKILAQSGSLSPSVYGVIDKVEKVDGVLIPTFKRRWKGTIGNMKPTDEEPTIWVIEKLEPLILKHKKVKGAWGGRAGTKSIMAMDAMIGEVNSSGVGVFCLRERMKSISQSIFKGMVGRVKDLNFSGFNPVESRWKIDNKNGGIVSFGGLMNVADMKSLFKYKYFFLEESHKTSQKALDILGPTLRGVDGAEQWMIWNPESFTDPMSKEFITPYQAHFDRDGYYEDDYHLIIKVGFEDNPFFHTDSSLVEEFEKDTQKMKDGRMSRSRYEHIWYGAFNDNVENSIVQADWFKSCIDAHKKLKWVNGNNKRIGFDPSDVGTDPAGIIGMTGNVVNYIDEIEAENGNRKFDVAIREAMTYSTDVFGWDGDGLGATLRDQAEKGFGNTRVRAYMYKGSMSVHKPNEKFKSENSNVTTPDGVMNKDIFDNRKSQNNIKLAEMIYKTHETVEHGIYHDPKDLISFDSEKINPSMLKKMESEACKMPLKPSTKIAFYSKSELRKGILMPDGSKLKIPSPNLWDALVVAIDEESTTTEHVWTKTSSRGLRSI